MLSDRKASILQAVVEGYISTASPVGSSYVKKTSALPVSAATVRNDMVALEEDGYLLQPHTSAGRIPTDKGYRYFVDTLMEPQQPNPAEATAVREFFDTAQGELERTLKSTSRFLAQLTDYAAVVTGAPTHTAPIRGVDLVRLDSENAMALVIQQDGSVAKHVVEISPDTTDETIADSGLLLREHLVGQLIGGAGDLRSTGDSGVDSLSADALAGVMEASSPTDTTMYVGGTAGVAGIFDAVEQVREVLALLDKQYVVLTLMKDLVNRGMKVAIGSETGVEPLAECSLIVAPYQVEGTPLGTIAVLGPTHMNYAAAMSTVGIVSQQLGQRLSEG